jgi:hypothetical protein
VFVVEFDSHPSSGARTFPDGMRIVEAQQAFPVTIVQRRRILQTVWFCWSRGDLLHLIFSEVALNNELFSIKLDKRVETVIPVHSF